MIQEEFTRPLKNLNVAIQGHISNRLNYFGLQMGMRLTAHFSCIVSLILLTGFASLILLMLSFAFVFWYGSHIGPYHHGFMIAGLFYLLLALLLYINRKKLILDPLARQTAKHSYTSGGLDDELGPVKSLDDMKNREEILKLKIEHSELVMQQKVQELSEAYAPGNISKVLLGHLLTSTTVLTKIALITTNVLAQRKAKKEKKKSKEDSEE